MRSRRWLGMGVSIALLAGLMAGALSAQRPQRPPPPPVALSQRPVPPDRCTECHLDLDDERLSAPAHSFQTDVHQARGFGCLACHGAPRPGEDAIAATGFLGKPARRAIAGICGRCHSDAAFMRDYNPTLRVDQVTEYLTSGHGLLLMQRDDPNVATCVDCHPPHGIRPPSDLESTVHPLQVAETCGSCHADAQRMARYDLPIDTRDRWAMSVHGRMLEEDGDLSAPTCNDCHGNHGAAPPGVGSVRNVCGQCHTVMADFFTASGHVEIFEEEGLPGCATCHGNHAVEETSDTALVTRSDEVCGRCHVPADPYGGEFLEMKRMIDSLKIEADRSRAILHDAENRGMEVSQALFELEEVNNALTKARGAIHALSIDPVKAEVDEGLKLTAAGLQRGEVALQDFFARRLGLAASFFFILALIAGIVVRIRLMELSSPIAEGSPPTRKGDSDAR